MATMDEQETTVTAARTDAVVYVYTSQAKHVRRMEADDRFTRREGDGETWGNYSIAASQFDPLKGIKRRPMSEEQRAAAVERLREARASRE